MDIIYLMQKEMLRRRYSPNTIKAYSDCARNFLKHCKKEARQINKSDVKNYLDYLAEKPLSPSSLNQSLMAIKFMLEQILNKRWYFIKLPYSKKPDKKPEVLSKAEIKRLIESVKNQEHRLMIKLLYSAGLRVGELVKLKVENLELDKGYGWVRKGKGNKDRLFIIAESLKDELLEHIQKSGSKWLFKGRNTHITTRSVQQIVRKAAKNAKINKKIHPHTLRHSFATHLIDNGYDVISVQSLLGHSSSETTMVYVHMASPKIIAVKSPLDSL